MRRTLAIAIVALLATALIGLASLPTGASRAEAVAPSDSRVAERTTVGGARVLLLSKAGHLRVMVAYRDDKGWFGVPVSPPPRDAIAAWTSTPGSGPVPALSAVYGRVDGATVEVRWRDGRVSRTTTASDGTFLVARAGRVRSSAVLVRSGHGDLVSKVSGP